MQPPVQYKKYSFVPVEDSKDTAVQVDGKTEFVLSFEMPDRNCSQAASFDWNAPDSASGQAPSWHKWTDYQTLNRKAFTGLVSDILTNQQDAWLNDNCQGELVKAAYRTNSLVNTAKGDSNLVIDSTASPSQVILNHAVRNLCPLMKGSEIYTAWETQGFTNKYDQTDLENALDLLKK